MKKTVKNSLLSFLLLVLVAVGLYVYQSNNKLQPEDFYKFVPITRGSIEQAVSANGTINPVTLVSVGTQVTGRVSKLYVDFNDKVEEGQLLLELEDILFVAQIEQSKGNVRNVEAALELAKANEARARKLYEQDYVSRQELDQAVQALKSAQAQLATTRAQLLRDQTNYDFSIIRSPVSGTVIDRQVDVGQTVVASFQTPTLIKIAQDLSKMQIDTSFAEADIGNIKVGQVAKFTVDAFPNLNFEGLVKQIRLNPVNTANVVSYNVVISVDNPEQILLPGMTAYVNIVFAKRDDALLVPNAALRYKPKLTENEAVAIPSKPDHAKKVVVEKQFTDVMGRGKLFVLENGKPKLHQVRVGITDGKYTEIVAEQLRPGVQVIVGDAQADAQAARAMRAPRMF
jgi:HlyD family secretion protein